MKNESKKNDSIGVPYTLFFIVLIALILLIGVNIYFWYCLHTENNKLHSEINDIYNQAYIPLNEVDPDITTNDKEILISFPVSNENDSSENLTSISDALAIMQSQYDTYISNLTMILSIFTAGFTLFGIAIPLLNYFFLQKDQIDKINSKFKKIKSTWDSKLIYAEQRLDEKIERLNRSIEQSQKVSEALASKNSVNNDDKTTNIPPISDTNKDLAFSEYLNSFVNDNPLIRISNLRKAIGLDPNNAKYHNSLGVALGILEHYDEALVEIQKAIDLDPNNAKYHNSLGITLHEMKCYDDAIIEIKKAIELKPNDAYYHYSLGVALGILERYKEALVEIRKAIDLEPNNAKYHDSLGTTLHEMKRYDEAIAETQKAIDLEPNNSLYYYFLGVTLYRMKRFGESLKHLTKSLNIDNTLARAYLYLGLAKIQINLQSNSTLYKDYIDNINKAISLDSDDFRNYRDCAEGYLLLNNTDKAKASLKIAEQMDNKDPQIYYLYSLLYEKLGDSELSKSYYEKALSLGYIEEPQ